jgi:putative transcriptional regulator
MEEARRVSNIDWARVDATTEEEIDRHAREDGTEPPSEAEWEKMIEEGQVRLVYPDGRFEILRPKRVDVRAIRERLGLSQTAFADRFGFTAAAVRQWEQGRRQPHGPARILLKIIDREPKAVDRALRHAAE